MVFDTGSYYANQNLKTFYPEVEIQFTTFDETHYHVPLLINPFGYNTYRGSWEIEKMQETREKIIEYRK